MLLIKIDCKSLLLSSKEKLRLLLTKYFAPGRVLRHQIEHALGLHHLVEFHNVGVVHQLHHLHLPVHLGQVAGVQLGLVNNLDGNLEDRRVQPRKQPASHLPLSW